MGWGEKLGKIRELGCSLIFEEDLLDIKRILILATVFGMYCLLSLDLVQGHTEIILGGQDCGSVERQRLCM